MTFADKLVAWIPLHRNRVNCAVHFIGGFMFVFAISVPLGWLRIQLAGAHFSAAMVLVALIALYVIRLQRAAGLVMALVLVPTLFAADGVSQLPIATGGLIALLTMAVRFTIVITGHVAFERKTHGLALGGPQLFLIEPVYLLTLAMFAMGMNSELKAQVDARTAQGE